MKDTLRRVFIVTAALAMAVEPVAARATPFYLGIGEDKFANDVTQAAAAIAPWIPAANIVVDRNTGAFDGDPTNPTAAAIRADITAIVARLAAGDVLILHYAGHGRPVSDPTDLSDPDIHTVDPDNLCGCDVSADHADEQIGPGGVGVTDDFLASSLSRVPAGATAYVILDNCFSGLALDDLGNLPVDFLSTADAVHCAPEVSKFLPLFVSAFSIVNNTFRADANRDGKLTEGELAAFTRNFTDTSNPQFFDGDTHGDLVITAIPEPCTGLLVVSGFVGVLYKRRSGQGRTH